MAKGKLEKKKFHVLVQYGIGEQIVETEIEAENGELAMREAEYFCFMTHPGTKLNDWFSFDFKPREPPEKVSKKTPVLEH